MRSILRESAASADQAPSMRIGWMIALVGLALGTGCGGGKAPAPAPPCDQACKDNIALRSLRETMRYVYNQRLPGQPVGAQDASANCLMQGTVQIEGDAGSNSQQGATMVELTYVFSKCFYSPALNATHDRNYAMLLSGTVTESGTLPAQSTSTTSLIIESQDFSFDGTVDHPPVEYKETGCKVDAAQNGNAVSGTVCGRPASFTGF